MVVRGVLLFLFIPLVLFLFVAHPAPVAASLLAGVALMLGHRLLARPYMERVRLAKCLWCNHVFAPAEAAAAEGLELEGGGAVAPVRCCPGHGEPVARFFAFLHDWRWPLRVGIFVPLLALLAALAATAAGLALPLAAITAGFKLAIGVTVNVAAFGYLTASPRAPLRAPFPAHNFFLLGVRTLLWIFRLVGIWWIVVGLRFFLAG